MSEVQVVYPRIDAARAIVEAEIAIIDCEISAFESFRSRLDRLEPNQSASVVGANGTAVAVSVPGVNPDAVETGYRDTVMAMDHYDREYGEPLQDHVEAEFGPEVRAVLAADSPIPTVQRDLILGAVDEVVNHRSRFRRTLADELDSLEAVEERLGDIERQLHALSRDSFLHNGDRTDKLEPLVSACDALATERQETIHARPAPRISGIGDRSLVAYLYGELELQFPALAEIADIASRIGWLRDRLAH